MGRTDVEAPILWSPVAKNDSLEKALMLGKTEGDEKGVREDEMVRQCHRHNGRESEQTLGDAGGQRSLACCSPRGHREKHTT